MHAGTTRANTLIFLADPDVSASTTHPIAGAMVGVSRQVRAGAVILPAAGQAAVLHSFGFCMK